MSEAEGCPDGERRRLTAEWLNIIAAGLVSAGALPLLHTLAVEGWGPRAGALAWLAFMALVLGISVHLAGRWMIRAKRQSGLDSSTAMFLLCSRARGTAMGE